MWKNKNKNKNMKKIKIKTPHKKITRKDVVWFLILVNVILWAIAYNKCKNFYNHYIELELRAAQAKQVEKEVKEFKEVKKLTVEDKIRQIAEQEGFANPDLLVKIAWCESRLDPYAINVNKNGTVDYGLFQFNSIHKLGEKPLDIEWATKTAIQWIRDGKLSAWKASKKCWAK